MRAKESIFSSLFPNTSSTDPLGNGGMQGDTLYPLPSICYHVCNAAGDSNTTRSIRSSKLRIPNRSLPPLFRFIVFIFASCWAVCHISLTLASELEESEG